MNQEFENIAPYSDERAVNALRERIAPSEIVPAISGFLFPDKDVSYLAHLLGQVGSVEDFQTNVMAPAVKSVISMTSSGFSFSGTDFLSPHTGYMFISNHRDITLDPALVQYALLLAGLPLTDICVGDNLIDNPLVEDIMRSNRMITVKRNVPARELLENSKILSAYIRKCISGGRSVWIAQSEGRTKDGRDRTAQGILKMLDMSGKGSFYDNFSALDIVPLAISYEYEPCDALKAREKVISRAARYVKRPGEDLNSIRTGITQYKGHIHLSFCKPLTLAEIEHAAVLSGNERFQELCSILDSRIASCYRLWNTNRIAYDILNGGVRFAGEYSPEEKNAFEKYLDARISTLDDAALDPEDLRRMLLEIYSNPTVSSLTLIP